jgi:E3 ubiquitin-protein ligase BRE1
LSDDDFARSDLFKHLKSQYEDVIKRVNGLEAINVQLRQEAEKLHAERSAHKALIESEVQATVGDLQSELERVQSDLTRIRAGRDELVLSAQASKASRKEELTAHHHIQTLAAAKEDRIKALESEIERLRARLGETSGEEQGVTADLDGLDVDDLRKRYRKLEQECANLNHEIPSLQGAYTKSQALASKKVMDFAGLEERVNRLQAEKAKAEQKYFGAMQLNEARQSELRALRNQNSQSADVIAQLKDTERAARALVGILEKQVAETKETVTSLTSQNHTLQQQVNRANFEAEAAKRQLAKFVDATKGKDESLGQAMKSQRQAETEVELLRSQLADAKKAVAELEAAAAGDRSQEFEALHVSGFPIPHQTLALLIHAIHRHSPTATSVDRDWSTRRSNSVAIPSAKIASMFGSRIVRGSVRPAARCSASAT